MVAVAVVNHAVFLVTHPNGILLLHWLVDADLPGRFRVLVPKLLSRAPYLANQKHAHVVIQKILAQEAEEDARRTLIEQGLFRNEETVALTMFGGHVPDHKNAQMHVAEYGTATLLKASQVCGGQSKTRVCGLLQAVVDRYIGLANAQSSRQPFLRRLMDELALIIQ